MSGRRAEDAGAGCAEDVGAGCAEDVGAGCAAGTSATEPASSPAPTDAGKEADDLSKMMRSVELEVKASRSTLSTLPCMPSTFCDSIYNETLSSLTEMTRQLNDKMSEGVTSEKEKAEIRGLSMAFYRSRLDGLSSNVDKMCSLMKDCFDVDPDLQLDEFAEDEKWKAATEADVERAEAANLEKEALLEAKCAEYEAEAHEVAALEDELEEKRRKVERLRNASAMIDRIKAIEKTLENEDLDS